MAEGSGAGGDGDRSQKVAQATAAVTGVLAQLPGRILGLVTKLWSIEWGERKRHRPVSRFLCASFGALLGVLVGLACVIFLAGTFAALVSWIGTAAISSYYAILVAGMIGVPLLVLSGAIGFMVGVTAPADMDVLTLAWRGSLVPIIFAFTGIVFVAAISLIFLIRFAVPH